MACKAMDFWTFSGLVGAFLDLSVAYFLLCASSIVFFTSKFLGLFGLSLPCPCDGLFVNRNSSYCVQKLLVDFPTEKASFVQMSVRSKLPFDSVLAKDQNLDSSTKMVDDGNCYGNGFDELEGEASCSSISDAKKSQNVVDRESIPRNEDGVKLGVTSWRKVDMKGKGITIHKPKIGIRRRKVGFGYGKISSTSSYDQLGVPWSPPSINKGQNEAIGGRSAPANFRGGANCFLDDGEAYTVMFMGNRGLHDIDLNQAIDENKAREKIESFDLELSDARGTLVDGDDINTIRVLEQALEEEHTARAALYLELEKERNAAATAADEAMAMILRLQEEKASIEMQARQYQRIIEEKSAYDAEEMNILKEILLRREREKHFLEKEVEAYRQMIIPGNEQLEGHVQDMEDNQRQEHASSVHLTEYTDPMLHELSESIEKAEMVTSRSLNLEVTSIDMQKYSLVQLGIEEWDENADFSKQRDQGKQFSSKCINDGNKELQEKKMVTANNSQHAQPKERKKLKTYLQSYEPGRSQEYKLLEKTIPIVGEEEEAEKNTYVNSCEGAENNVKTQNESGIYILNHGQDLEGHGKDVSLGSKILLNTIFDKELDVHDVHIIDDSSKCCNEVNEKKSELLSETDTTEVNIGDLPHEASIIQKIDTKRDSSSTSTLDTMTHINRSSSDMAIGLSSSGSMGRFLLSDMRRSSMSALLDTERIKIDIEVEWLREKLRTVQEGREKLNLSLEHQEREKLQLQLLEDIVCQLREIRQLREPEKFIRQVSLPPPFSKVMSKKRRCRTASLNKSSR